MSKPKLAGASDADVIALLKRYQCPTPFHAVRALFMGNIASPAFNSSPLETLKLLWDGELPTFDHIDDANVLFDALVAGLWNRLTEHQDSRNPFRLTRFEVAPTREGLKNFSLVRQQELEGFIEGLFGSEQVIHLPERAHKAVAVLVEVRAMLAGAVGLLDDLTKPADSDGLRALIYNIQKITLSAETEMNKAILSCKRARSQTLENVSLTKPTLH